LQHDTRPLLQSFIAAVHGSFIGRMHRTTKMICDMISIVKGCED